MKPKAGLVELDIPITAHQNFDKIKGIRWGTTLKQAKDNDASTFGLASGFGNTGIRSGGGRNDRSTAAFIDNEDDGEGLSESINNYDNMVHEGLVLQEQTLGGLVLPDEPDKPLYMLGAFTGCK